MVPITNGTEVCNDYAGCLALLKEGKAIDYNGRSGAVNFWDAGDPTSASIGVYTFGADNVLMPEVTYMEGEIVPEGEANPIDAKPQEGANDGTFKVGTFLPVTGNLAFLGPPEIAMAPRSATTTPAASRSSRRARRSITTVVPVP